MIVVHRQEFLLPLVQPLLPRIGLTLRTMPVPARVIRDGLISAAPALVAVPAECRRAAAHDGREHFDLRPSQRLAIAFQELAAGSADDIGHLPGWPRHLSVILDRRFLAVGANLDLLQRVDGGVQMTLGQVEVDDRVFQFLMAQQHLDGTQIGTGFQQVRGKAVAPMSSEDIVATIYPS